MRSFKEGTQRRRSVCKKDRRFVCTKIVWNIANVDWGARFLEIIRKLIERRKCNSSIKRCSFTGNLFIAERRANDNINKHSGTKASYCNERLQRMGRSIRPRHIIKLHPIRPSINRKHHVKSIKSPGTYKLSSIFISHSSDYQVHGLPFQSIIYPHV